MMDKRQLTQYRDSLIEEHVGIVKDKDFYDTTVQEAVLIGQISCLTHAIQDGGYDPIKKKVRRLIESDPIESIK
jgi:hypothetical protein